MAGCHVAMNLAADAEGLWTMPRAQAMDRLLVVYGDVARQAASERSAHNPHVRRYEYEVAAFEGLRRAAAKYDPMNDARASFPTYAMMRIWGCMVDVERANDWVPNKVRTLDKACGEDSQIPLMFSADRESSAELLGMTVASDERKEAADGACEELAALLKTADPEAAEILREAVAVEFDLVALGERLGGDYRYGIACYDAARHSVRTGEKFIRPTLKAPRKSPTMAVA